MRTAGDLGKAVLRDVSRSFYLSLRVLPRGFREPASLGYLLARLSDTIADAGSVPLKERKTLLEKLRLGLADSGDERGRSELFGQLAELADMPGWSAGEATLLRRSGEVVNWFDVQEPAERDLVSGVVSTIISGQAWDLTRFEDGRVIRLEEDAELDEYTYRVAGCVGEFWTRLGALERGAFARADFEEMMRLGRSYGQGLQLVNILRDLSEDWERGRCYLPGPETSSPEDVLRDRQRWQKLAEERLRCGLEYCRQLRGRRLGFASGLPALLGLLTLQRLSEAGWEDLRGTVKVTRAEVRAASWFAMKAALGDAPDRWEQAWERLLRGSKVTES